MIRTENIPNTLMLSLGVSGFHPDPTASISKAPYSADLFVKRFPRFESFPCVICAMLRPAGPVHSVVPPYRAPASRSALLALPLRHLRRARAPQSGPGPRSRSRSRPLSELPPRDDRPHVLLVPPTTRISGRAPSRPPPAPYPARVPGPRCLQAARRHVPLFFSLSASRSGACHGPLSRPHVTIPITGP